VHHLDQTLNLSIVQLRNVQTPQNELAPVRVARVASRARNAGECECSAS
jgi:hypothetical protein